MVATTTRVKSDSGPPLFTHELVQALMRRTSPVRQNTDATVTEGQRRSPSRFDCKKADPSRLQPFC